MKRQLKIGLVAMGMAVAGAVALAAPWTPQNAAHNVNMNPNGANPAAYYGAWDGHTYFPSPDDWRKVPVYQFITDRFCDGNPENNDIGYGGYDLRNVGMRHGGDFKGIEMRLDYIKALGYRAIWISPVFQNLWNSYHGYGQIDFTLLDERFGTLEEFRSMVKKAHSLGLYVIVDIVVNHLSDLYHFEGYPYGDAPFRLHGGEYKLHPHDPAMTYADFWVNNTFDPNGKYCDVYDENGFRVVDNYGMSGSYWNSDLHHNGDLRDYSDEWQNHLGDIYGFYDDVRTSHPRVQDKIIAMTKALISSCDIDGIRMDTPMQVPYYFFSRWCPAVKAHAASLGKDNFWIFGEFFCERGRAATMIGRGKEPHMVGNPSAFIGNAFTMDGGINYRAYFGFFQPALKDQVNGCLGNLKDNYYADWLCYDLWDPERNEHRYTMLNFYNNHDQWRMVHNPAGADAGFKKTDLGSAIIAFWPGIPLFYYGDEQGFCSYGTALDGWSREDFMTSLAWQNVNALVWPNPANIDNFDMTHPRFLHVQKCMNIRSQYPALQNTDAIYERWRQSNNGNGIYAYSRAWGSVENWALVAFNTWGGWLEAGGGLGDFFTGWAQGDVVVNAFNPSETYTLGAGGRLNLWLAPYECKVLVRQSRHQALHPVVSGSVPKHDERVGGGAYTIRLYFSEPMNEASLKAAFRYDGAPVSASALSWNPATRELSYAANVSEGLHTVEVLDSAVSAAGKNLFGRFRSRFRSGSDQNILCNPNATTDAGLINGGAASTAARAVTLHHKAAGAEKYRAQNGSGAWSAWQTYAAQTLWTLPEGPGDKSVTVQYWADGSAAYYVTDSIRLTDADNDGDGMPDSWELQYGLNPNNPADAAQDPDGDGYTNLQEYQNGTNPTVPEPKKSGYSSMTLAGTFNAWNPAAHNMTLVADWTWRATLTLNNASGVQFKFTANGNWTVNWGETNQSDFTLPDLAGTAEQTGNNIAINGTVNGTMTVTFNEQTRAYTVVVQGPADADGDGMPDAWELQHGLNPNNPADAAQDPDGDGYTNLQEYQNGTDPNAPNYRDQLNNAGFETQGSSAETARNWQQNQPDVHGEMWGSAARTSWRSHGGTYEGVLRGTWAGQGNFGGFWQEVPVVPGRTYRFSGWFWADSTWVAGSQKIKIEFLSGATKGDTYLKVVETNLGSVGQTWVQKSVLATAPTNAQWVRVVIEATGIQYHGALQFDDLLLERLADSDGDGMPDEWEILYGLNPNSAADAAQDPDGDGYTNLQEYQNGTHPKVAEPKKSNYTSMTLAGTLNGWNPAARNMTLIADYTWRATLNLANVSGLQFKFTANGNWNVNWGDNNQNDFTAPLTQAAERTGSNVSVSGTLNGVYVVTFNESTGAYSVQAQ